MADTEHLAITDPEIHEPKGASTALSGAVYVSDGAGSGNWSVYPNRNKTYLTTPIADISTADSVLFVSPVAGTVTGIWTVLGSVISVADATITLSDKDGNTMTTLTVAYSGSAKGDVDSDTAVATNNDVAAGDWFEVATDGGSTTTAELFVTVEITGTVT